MSVSTSTRKQQFTLDGTTAAFTFTFRALTSAPSDIKCIKTSGGVDTDLTYTTDFTVSVNSNGIGGTVTLVSPSSVGTGTLTVYRETTNTQASDYDDYNQFPADTLEKDLDIRTLVAQEQGEALDRILQLPISYSGTASTTLPTPVAERLIGWNASGSGLTNYVPNSADYLTAATQAEAEAGTNTTAYMTPLRVSQAITALQTSKASAAEAQAGSNNTKYMTPSTTSLAITALAAPGGGVLGSAKNLVIQNGSPTASTVTITADEVVLETSSNTKYIARSVSVTLDIAGSVGAANGLDAGSEAANILYYLWLIYNGTTVASLTSTSSTTPILPSGYTYKALVGVVGNNNSSNFIAFKQVGRVYMFDIWATLGTGSVGAGAWTSLDLTPANMTTVGGFVPSALSTICFGSMRSDTAANTSMTNDSGVSTTINTDSANRYTGYSGAHTQNIHWQFNVLTADTLYWQSDGASARVYLAGFLLNKLA